MKTSIILLAVVSLVFVSGAPLDSSDAVDSGAVQTNDDENTYKILPVEETASDAPINAVAESESAASEAKSVPEPAQDATVVHATQPNQHAKTKEDKPGRRVNETDSSEIEIIHHNHKNKEKNKKEKHVKKEVVYHKKQQKDNKDVAAEAASAEAQVEEPVAEPVQDAPAQEPAAEQ